MLRSRWLALSLKTAVSLVLVAFLANRLDRGTTWSQLRAIDLVPLALVCGLLVLQVLVSAARWHAIITAERPGASFPAAARAYYIGVFFNTCTPGGVYGDFVRVWYAHRCGLSVPSAINSVVLDRIVVVTSLILATLTMQPALPTAVKAQLQASGLIYLFWAVLGALAVGLIAVVVIAALPKMFDPPGPLRVLVSAARSMRQMLHPRRAAWVLILAIISQSILCASMYELALALHIGLPMLDYMILMPPVILASILPVSIGGWGVRESAMVFVLGATGVAAGQAFVLSVLVGLSAAIVSLPGCGFWLLSDRAEVPAPRDGELAKA